MLLKISALSLSLIYDLAFDMMIHVCILLLISFIVTTMYFN